MPANEYADLFGNKWRIALTVYDVERIRQDFELDLLELVEIDSDAGKRLAKDPVLLCQVLYTLCEKQAAAAGIEPEDFARGLGGDAIAHAIEALMEGLTDFFPDPRRRELLRRLWRQRTELDAKATEQAGLLLFAGESEYGIGQES